MASKEYHREYSRAWAKRNRAKLKEYESMRRQRWNDYKEKLGCLNPACPWSETYPACILEFHHLNPADKTRNVCHMTKRNEEIVWAEIEKCTLLCANCHRLERNGLLDVSAFPRCKRQA